jgi:hypothetical protein
MYRCWQCHREFKFDQIVIAEAKEGRARFLCASCDEAAKARVKKYEDKPKEKEFSEPTWGTSSAAFAIVKLASEEAKLMVCPDCGYANGRHAKVCRLA